MAVLRWVCRNATYRSRLLKEYEIRHAADKEEREELLRLRNQKDITADGKEIKLLAEASKSG